MHEIKLKQPYTISKEVVLQLEHKTSRLHEETYYCTEAQSLTIIVIVV